MGEIYKLEVKEERDQSTLSETIVKNKFFFNWFMPRAYSQEKFELQHVTTSTGCSMDSTTSLSSDSTINSDDATTSVIGDVTSTSKNNAVDESIKINKSDLFMSKKDESDRLCKTKESKKNNKVIETQKVPQNVPAQISFKKVIHPKPSTTRGFFSGFFGLFPHQAVQ